MKYLLPCSCGNSVAVEISQAGETVPCVCGQVLEVPTLRAIRQLQPAAATTATPRRHKRAWSLPQRILFAVGLGITVLGLARAGYYQLGRATLQTEERPWDDLERAHAEIDGMNIDTAWEFWKIARDKPIGPYDPPAFVLSRFFSGRLLKVVIQSLVVAGIGVLILLSAFFVGPRSHSRRGTATATRSAAGARRR